MVAQDSNHTIGLIVSIEFLLHSCLIGRIIVQLFLESDGGVVCTENFRRQTLHFGGQMFVEKTRLMDGQHSTISVRSM